MSYEKAVSFCLSAVCKKQRHQLSKGFPILIKFSEFRLRVTYSPPRFMTSFPIHD
jgi:hypothetical protein